jgi:hypothetical protein
MGESAPHEAFNSRAHLYSSSLRVDLQQHVILCMQFELGCIHSSGTQVRGPAQGSH